MQPATARALIGAAAPAFTLTDSNGRNLSLADFKGKTVVLEWTNHECPYVGKHYRGNNMQALQKKWTGQGVVWLSVISSAARPAGLCLATAGKQAHGRSGRGAHCGAV
jgi:cytochrome oxidase Cu insertion factor (SCO1/SenC/PrrC family)